MPISWNEIRNRAYAFVNEWKGETDEHAEAKSFWDDFFNVFGVSRRRVATFEKKVRKASGNRGFIDLLWKGTLLIEHKSRGKNLHRAHQQAIAYFPGLKDAELPRYILVCDFASFRMYDLEQDGNIISEFSIEELPDNIEHFGFIAGYQKTVPAPEDPVNIKAAEKMAKLHDKLKEAGYEGHDLRVMLVRLLFCLFGEDTGIFERNLFRDLILNHTHEDGSDLGMIIAQLFQALNTPEEARQKTLPQHFDDFSYVNGKLFEEQLRMAAFDSEMREFLLNATMLNWSYISPAIFGSLFQGVMDDNIRLNLGAHYTSESNILKLVKPLFLDRLWEEFKKCKTNKKALERFHDKLVSLKFLDPACGCGNFLVITYRELRLLELKVLLKMYPANGLGHRQGILNIRDIIRVNVDQFFGIEIEEFPAQITQVALWLTDHQMNIRVSEAFGLYFVRLPLKTSATIVHGNALTTPWEDIVAKEKLSYILGNPPFVGKHLQSQEQKHDLGNVFAGVSGAGNLDYVAAWYWLACKYSKDTNIKTAFVSTNSITQGEQAGILWKELFNKYGLKIHFAHQTFKWGNEASNNAAVHCVIIGFSRFDVKNKSIWIYENPNSEPLLHRVKNISPYLVEGDDIAVSSRSTPICDVPKCGYGSKPTDGGHLILSNAENETFLTHFPEAAAFIRPLLSAQEYLHGEKRWCIWLQDADPQNFRKISGIMERIKKVRDFRLASKKAQTRAKANEAMLFAEIRQPDTNFIVIPQHSSENRKYIPFGFFPPDYILHNSCSAISGATLYHFGVLSSTMHMAWIRYTAGRLESRYRYSTRLVYNNFPWPSVVLEKKKKEVEKAGQAVLSARSEHQESTLADLYDPLAMPLKLSKAHDKLDKVVDKCYRSQPFSNEIARITFLFDRYSDLISKQKLADIQ